jgi:PAS domain S-box-containing protein
VLKVSKNIPSSDNTATDLAHRIGERFGVLPNFFRLAPETPEITEKLWGFAQVAYLDNPLPSVFKERLFIHLSRFCAVRYCIARHVGFLVGLGHPAGDQDARTQSILEIVNLLRRPFPRGPDLQRRLSVCGASSAPLVEMPSADTEIEDAIFALASHVFLQTSDTPACIDAIERLLGAVRFQYLLLLLTFVRAAHYWTRVHPEIEFEDDIKQLLVTHEALASCILQDPEAGADLVAQSLLDELPALRQKADRAVSLMASIVESSGDAIISKTLEGVITSWNSGAERLFGYTAKEAIGRSMSLVIPVDRMTEEETLLEKLRRGERIEHFDTVRVRKDGTLLDISLTISPVRDSANNITGVSKIARDVTHRKQAEKALRESEDRFRALADALDTQVQFRTQELQRRNAEILGQSELLRDLSGRLLITQDEERRRIARELHDSAGQVLAALSMDLSRLEDDVQRNPDRLTKGIKDAQDRLQLLSQEIRTTSYLLHPPLLDEVGLSSALQWYIEGLAERSGLDIRLSVADDLERLSPEMELTIFRLVQECLTNIHRHAGSKTAHIRLAREPDRIYLEVQDQGQGMSQERIAKARSKGVGVGITGMRERVRQLRGELVIESDAGGTKITATFPHARHAASA